MALVIPVEDGKVVDTSASTNSNSEVNESSGGSLDKEAFLQLLVAQMKYQDPLEPTSNTEYISQLATFSSLEQMQNLNSTMQTQQATNLVGKTVIMKVTGKSGETTYVQGRVDYIVKERGKTYLSIDEGLYCIDDLDKVVDDDYLDALAIADEFEKEMDKLPSVKNLTLNDKDNLEKVKKAYESLSSYQQNFIEKYSPTAFAKLKELLARMKELDKAAEGDKDDTTGGTGSTESAGGTEGTGGTGNTESAGGTEGTGGTGNTEGTSTV